MHSTDAKRRRDRFAFSFHPTDEYGAPMGSSATFVELELNPLTYENLLALDRTNPIPVPLSIRSALVHESTLPDLAAGARIKDGACNLGPVFECRQIGLVDRGWLPPGIGLFVDPIVCLDQCTLSDLKGWFRGGEKVDPNRRDFIDFLSFGSVRINPCMYLLEGNQRRKPTRAELHAQYDEVCAALHDTLPYAQIVPAGTSSLDGILALIEHSRDSMARQQRFLMELACHLQSPVSIKNRERAWHSVLASANRHGVESTSLVAIAALSCVVAPQHACPARRVLKPKGDYAESDAYNALADLQKLELLLNHIAMFSDEELMLCTRDVGLARFWTALGAEAITRLDGKLTLTFAWPHPLFPSIPREWLLALET